MVPLNLLGTFSEQPDFLVTPEVLPWVAATRGDRHWKTAPGGHTSPIIVRTWEALEQRGSQTAGQLREVLGREVTEGAVLRALIELWTTVRAMPVYVAGEATRWHLLKERHPAQLATAGNTAQATALSALISLYLQSAVAATGEETEIFLSPLTARSRIREVLHGMTATRQLGTMSVASQTLLFVEGSLPEVAPVAEPEPERAMPAPERPARRERREEGRGERRPERRGPVRREARPERPDRERREGRPERFGRERPPRREFRPAAPKREERVPGRPFEKGRDKRREGGPREGKPWPKRRGFQQREGRPPFRKPFQQREPRPEQPGAPARPQRPERPAAPGRQGAREERPRFGKGSRPQFGKRLEGRPPRREPDREGRPQRPGKKFAGPPRFGRSARPPGREFRKGFSARGPAGGERPKRAGRPEGQNRGAFRPGKKGRGTFSASSRTGKPRPGKNGKQKTKREERREEGSE